MKPLKLLLFIGLYLLAYNPDLLCQELTVLNVHFTQRADSTVVVTYDLIGNLSKKYKVALSLISADTKRSFSSKIKSVTGDIGENVRPGQGLRIIWNLPKDFPKGLEGEGFVFVVDVYEQKGGSKFPWIIAGLAVAGGGAVYLLTTSSSQTPPSEPELPRPPNFP